MIAVNEAQKLVRENTGTLGSEIVGLREAVGRIIAADIIADSDMPPFDRSQMDGYAVRYADTTNAPVTLKIVGESAAGRGWHNELSAGQAVRIMTGAPVPKGADAIQKVELSNEIEGVVTIVEATTPARYIVGRGSEIRKNDIVFRTGERVTANMVPALASFGYDRLRVSRQPRVAVLSTGSEIVDIDEVPGSDQIRNSNSAMLDVLSAEAGAAPKTLDPVGDDLDILKEAIESAIDTDILVITGGVSVGKYDLTKAALSELGCTIFFDQLRLKPGKPMVFGKVKNTLVFGLPGNPASAAVTFYLFVRQAILQMQSANETSLRKGTAVLTRSARATKERDTFLPAVLHTAKEGRLFAEPLKFGGSSDMVGFAKAEALIELPKGKVCDEGDVITIHLL